ncbi:MAG: acyltransferase [Burkholderiales bacterium]|jgi:peptidoglycan/LPS O-acetylase OafA/YrhL|nr:acyltransferase [Burkholderiales bacterium]MCA3161973.1 acyltransferase [Burkholderiales bacterium]MCA3164895.1 acyltransferase [Burkholderiales bacterium]MCA3171527.1 acyltransferase [Burkholderiales bacterium]
MHLSSKAGGNAVRQDIQGLRALAVLAVIIFHANKNWLPGGFVGVDIFFVITGYLITSIINERKSSGTFSFSHFYLARIKRIIPAYFFVLVICTLAFSVLFIPADFVRFFDSLKSASLFLSNKFFAAQADYFAPAVYETPLVHTWSLAVEMQFYLFFPLFMIFAPKRILVPAIFLVIVISVSYTSYTLLLGERQSAYYSLWARVPEFLIGCLLAVFPTRQIQDKLRSVCGIAGFGMILASFWFLDEKRLFPGLLALLPTVGAFLIIAAREGLVSTLLSNPLLARVGDLSYSLYLWHWPILAGLRYYSGDYHLSWGELVLFSFLTGAFSLFSYKYVEAPFRRSSATPGALLRSSLCLALVTLPVFFTGWFNQNLVPTLPVALTRYAAPDEICHEKIVGECLRGEFSSKQVVLMVGDSHAAQLNLFADEIGRGTNTAIRVITASSCITIPGFDWQRLPEWAQATCKKHIEFASQYVEKAKIVIIAGMWQYHTSSPAFMKAFETYLRSASEREQKIIIMAQIPMLISNVQREYRYESIGIGTRTASIHPEWKMANKLVQDMAEKIKNVQFLDLSHSPLFSSPPIYQGTLIYRDDNHLNEAGAKLLGKYAVPVFRDLLKLD